jgi:hypothetical protein
MLVSIISFYGKTTQCFEIYIFFLYDFLDEGSGRGKSFAYIEQYKHKGQAFIQVRRDSSPRSQYSVTERILLLLLKLCALINMLNKFKVKNVDSTMIQKECNVMLGSDTCTSYARKFSTLVGYYIL